MISPDEFYKQDDLPAGRVRRELWKKIAQQLPRGRSPLFIISDRRSFVFGMAATVVLYLAGMGTVAVVRQMTEASQEPVMKLDRAYQSAIRELESVAPYYASTAKATDKSGRMESWEQQLQRVNDAIAGLRIEIEARGPSAIKLMRLRELYALKLHVLQSMIEHGDMEL